MMGAFVASPLVDFELKLDIRLVVTYSELGRGRHCKEGACGIDTALLTALQESSQPRSWP